MLDALSRFETARRVIGHDVTLTDEQIWEIVYPAPGVRCKGETVLTRLADKYLEKSGLECDEPPALPVPSVDITHMVVSHTTWAGRTTLTVQLDAASMTRTVPLDPDDPRDIALWLLMDSSLQDSESNVFGQEPGRRKPGYALRASDGTILDSVRAMEGIARLVAAQMSLEDACGLAQARGIAADPETVFSAITSRYVGLWLAGRTHCAEAMVAMALCSDPVYVSAGMGVWDIPAEARETKRQMELACIRDAWLLAKPEPPVPAKPAAEDVPDWERELRDHGNAVDLQVAEYIGRLIVAADCPTRETE
jgi:hypothetical protein